MVIKILVEGPWLTYLRFIGFLLLAVVEYVYYVDSVWLCVCELPRFVYMLVSVFRFFLLLPGLGKKWGEKDGMNIL